MVPEYEVFKKINYKYHSLEIPESAPRKAMRPCFPPEIMNLYRNPPLMMNIPLALYPIK